MREETMKIEVAKYTDRFFAVYVDGELLAVTVYRKGAVAIKNFLENLAQPAGPQRSENVET